MGGVALVCIPCLAGSVFAVHVYRVRRVYVGYERVCVL
jgi:hypothetical protein